MPRVTRGIKTAFTCTYFVASYPRSCADYKDPATGVPSTTQPADGYETVLGDARATTADGDQARKKRKDPDGEEISDWRKAFYLER
ncbi:hypothetical protein E8E11_009999 [Didymella keratinophila]|nr:hypothetical protein E8E11_009999 [Didymella keratinophila]